MSKKTYTKVRCLICGVIFEATEKICPVCGVGEEHFVPVPEEEAPSGAQDRESEEEKFVIVGSGIAGVAAAEEIRRIHPSASIVMVGEETALPYYRPSLSKELLLPQVGDRFTLHPPEWYSKKGIFLLSGRQVTRILPRAKQVELADGEVLHYDKCILATGSRSAVPPIEGYTLPGVFTLRTLADFETIAQHIRPDLRAVVIGGGVLGLESAWQLYLGGCHVTVLEAAESLLAGRVEKEISDRLIRIASARGVDIRTGVRISRLEGEERICRIILPGEYLGADLLLFCCGSRPRTELAQEAGLEVDRGILVNSRMMTGKYGIYACGDCAQIGQDGCGMWNTAENMGHFAGRNAAGEDALYHPCPTPLWMDAFGTRLFATGDCGTGSKTCRVEREDSGSALYYHDEKLVGAVLLGDTSQASALLRAIDGGKKLSTV